MTTVSEAKEGKLEGVHGWCSSEIHTKTERAESAEEQVQLYTKWADTYDAEMDANDLASFKSVTAKVMEFWASDPQQHVSYEKKKANDGDFQLRVLDAGCGTGLLGRHFREKNKIEGLHLSGLDLCPELLKHASKKGCYDHLVEGNLLKELPFPEDHFHHIISSGVFLPGHVGAEAIQNILPVLKPGGMFISTVRETMYKDDEGKFHEVIQKSNGQLLEAKVMPYYGEIDANVLVIRKKKDQ